MSSRSSPRSFTITPSSPSPSTCTWPLMLARRFIEPANEMSSCSCPTARLTIRSVAGKSYMSSSGFMIDTV